MTSSGPSKGDDALQPPVWDPEMADNNEAKAAEFFDYLLSTLKHIPERSLAGVTASITRNLGIPQTQRPMFLDTVAPTITRHRNVKTPYLPRCYSFVV
jgi:hypothetical protein